MIPKLNGVVVDLAPHPAVAYAVVFRGQLLPIRFSTEGEANTHLYGMETGTVLVHTRDATQSVNMNTPVTS